MKRLKKITKYLLIFFSIFSFGFIAGKHYNHKDEKSAVTINKLHRDNIYEKVVVYYLHGTFKCVSCETIEKYLTDLLQRHYNNEITTKKLIYEDIDFQKNESYAKKFNVASNSIVIAKYKGRKLIKYDKLDDVWTKLDNQNEFNKYVTFTLDKYLQGVE